MQFPRLMFRSPGPEQCQGGTYAHVAVDDRDQFDAAMAKGWHGTLPDALAPPPEKAATQAAPTELPVIPLEAAVGFTAPPAQDTPPTRDEMKQKAAELSLTYAHNISNIKLAELIDAAMAKG